MLIIQRVVCIRLHIACLLRCICNLRKIQRIVRVRLLNGIPHFKKHHRQTLVAACKTNLSINDRNLSVIPVIHKYIDKRYDFIENPALYAVAFHLLHKIRIDKAHTANIIINQTNFHTFLRLLKENTFHARKGLCILDGMILHKDELFCL